MALLVARQCRLLGTRRGAICALQRLQRPAVTVPIRSFGLLGNEAPPRSSISHSKQPLSHNNEQQRHGSRHLTTAGIEESEIVPVNSAILVPASVTAAVSAPAVPRERPLTSAETRAFHREAHALSIATRLDETGPCRLPRHSVICAMAPRRPRVLRKGAAEAVQRPAQSARVTTNFTRHMCCCGQTP